MVLRAKNKIARRRGVGTSIVASLMLGLWLGLMALAASAELHQHVHPDAKAPGHECDLMLLANGGVLAASSDDGIELAAGWRRERPPVELRICLLDDYRFSPSRAPPAS